MDDSNRQGSEQGRGGSGSGETPASPGVPSQPAGNYPPPPPPPPVPQPYPQGAGQGQQPYPGDVRPPQQPYPQDYRPQQPGYGSQSQGDYGGYNQPTEAYPAGGQGVPSRYEDPTQAYPQPGYTPGQVPPGQDYRPQGPYPQYPPQYGPPVPPQQQVNVAAKKKGPPVWAWLVPLLLVLGVGGALITWSVLQAQENERKAQAAATSTAQAQATATAIQAETNRKNTATAVAQKTATAVTAAENKNKTATAQARATGTAQAQATSQAQETANAKSTSTAIAQVTSTALAALSQNQTATALSQIPVDNTPTAGGVTDISGQIQSVTVDYDVTQENVKGMLIHVKFTVDQLKDARCQATAYFYYDNNQPVKDTDGQYNTVDGQVAVSEPFNPGFDSTVYEDFQLFMPYDQFDLGPGSYNMRFQVQAYVLSPYRLIAVSDYVDFSFSK